MPKPGGCRWPGTSLGDALITAQMASGMEAARLRHRRSFALNILRARGVANVSEAIYTNALSLDCLLAYGQPMSEN